MKKNILFILSIIGALAIGIFLGNKLNTLVSKPVRIETIHTTYTQYGRYYTSGTLITMVYDRTTACMDALEEELSDSFTLTRNENTITIQTHK